MSNKWGLCIVPVNIIELSSHIWWSLQRSIARCEFFPLCKVDLMQIENGANWNHIPNHGHEHLLNNEHFHYCVVVFVCLSIRLVEVVHGPLKDRLWYNSDAKDNCDGLDPISFSRFLARKHYFQFGHCVWNGSNQSYTWANVSYLAQNFHLNEFRLIRSHIVNVLYCE